MREAHDLIACGKLTPSTEYPFPSLGDAEPDAVDQVEPSSVDDAADTPEPTGSKPNYPTFSREIHETVRPVSGRVSGSDGEPVVQVQADTPRERMVPISQIMRGDDVHTRQAVDEKTVHRFEEALDAGDPIPPGLVFHDGERYWLSDGRHRIEAHVRKGHDVFPAEVRPGGRRDAILHALTCDRNLARNSADKKKAATLLLLDPEWRQWSDREIARRSGASAPTVGKLRKELGLVDEARKGKDGKKRKVTKIGRKPKRNCKRFTVGGSRGSDTTSEQGTSTTATDAQTDPPAAAEDAGTEDGTSSTGKTTGDDATTQADHADAPTTAPATEEDTTAGDTDADDTTAGDTDGDNQPNAEHAVLTYKAARTVVWAALQTNRDLAESELLDLADRVGIDILMLGSEPKTNLDELWGHAREVLGELDRQVAMEWLDGAIEECKDLRRGLEADSEQLDEEDGDVTETEDADPCEEDEDAGRTTKRGSNRGIRCPVRELEE